MTFTAISNTIFRSKPAAIVTESGRIDVFCIGSDQRMRRLIEGGRVTNGVEEFLETVESRNLASNHLFIDHPVTLQLGRGGGYQLFALEQTKKGIFASKSRENFNWEGYFDGGGLIGGAEVAGTAAFIGGRPILATLVSSGGKRRIFGRNSDESGGSLSNAFEIGPGQNIDFIGTPVFGPTRNGSTPIFARDQRGFVFELGLPNGIWSEVGNRAIGQRPFASAHGDLALSADGLVLHTVDNQGNLHICRRAQSSGWGAWQIVAEGLLPSSVVNVVDDLRGRYLIAHFRDGNLYYKYFYRRGSLSTEWILIGRSLPRVAAVFTSRDNKLKIFGRDDAGNIIMESTSFLHELTRAPYVAYHNGFWGLLKFSSFDLTDNTFTGEAYGDPITGSFNPETREFTFQRHSQTWKFTLTELKSLSGTMTQTENPSVFSWTAKREARVKIKTYTGKYWRNNSAGNSPVMANLDTPNPMILETQPDGHIAIKGGQVYAAAEGGGGGLVTINRTWVRDWEKFVFHAFGNNQVAFQCKLSRRYLTAENGGGSEIVANRDPDVRREWETFEVKEF